jgi:hypothetical protein
MTEDTISVAPDSQEEVLTALQAMQGRTVKVVALKMGARNSCHKVMIELDNGWIVSVAPTGIKRDPLNVRITIPDTDPFAS